jgi:hypothetical protein
MYSELKIYHILKSSGPLVRYRVERTMIINIADNRKYLTYREKSKKMSRWSTGAAAVSICRGIVCMQRNEIHKLWDLARRRRRGNFSETHHCMRETDGDEITGCFVFATPNPCSHAFSGSAMWIRASRFCCPPLVWERRFDYWYD